MLKEFFLELIFLLTIGNYFELIGEYYVLQPK